MGFPTPFNNEIAAQLKQSRMDKQFAQTPTGASIKAYKNQHKRTGSSLLRDAKANTQGLGAAAHREFIQPITNAVDGLRQSGFVKALGFGESPLEQGRRVTNAKHRMQYAAPIASPTQQAAPDFDILRGGVTMLSREEEQTPFAGIPQSAQESMTRTNRENLAGPGQTSQAINPSGGGQAQIFANGSKFSGAEQGGTSVYSPTKQSGFAPAANMQDRVASYGRATDTYKQMGNIRKGLSAGGGNSDGRAKQPRAQKPHIGWGERKRMQNIMTELQSLNGHSHGKYAAPALLAEYKNILGQGQATNQLQNNLDMQGMRNTGGAEVAGIGANAQTGVAGLRAGAGLQQAQINNQGQNFRNQASNQMQMDRQGMIGEQASGLAAMNNKSAENRARIAGQYSLAGAGLKAGGKSGGGLANTDKLISRYKKTGRDLPQGAAQGIYASSSARHLNNPAQVDSLLAATYSKYPELKDLLDLSDGKTWDAMIQAQKTGNWEAVRPKN